MLEVLLPIADDDNKATIFEWGADNFNDLKTMFPSPLILDYKKMAKFKPPMEGAGGEAGGAPGATGKPHYKMGELSRSGSTRVDSVEEAVIDYLTEVEARKTRIQQRLQPQQTTEGQ